MHQWASACGLWSPALQGIFRKRRRWKFTGSTATGKKVLAAAAKNLTPVTLELGGKEEKKRPMALYYFGFNKIVLRFI